MLQYRRNTGDFVVLAGRSAFFDNLRGWSDRLDTRARLEGESSHAGATAEYCDAQFDAATLRDAIQKELFWIIVENPFSRRKND
jgi:hypothetical protein